MSAGRPASLKERIESVVENIEAAAARVGRDWSQVNLIGVSKTVPANAVVEAWICGITDFGENRLQEAVTKIPEVRSAVGDGPKFHLIGHLQGNKVAAALSHFSMIHSVDSLRLLRRIADRADTEAEPLQLMLQVNVSGEATKFGMTPGEVPILLDEARETKAIAVTGLMTVPPRVTDPELVRPYFFKLRELGEKHGLRDLSMGMTEDYEVAVEEGATHVRVGRAIFGERES